MLLVLSTLALAGDWHPADVAWGAEPPASWSQVIEMANGSKLYQDPSDVQLQWKGRDVETVLYQVVDDIVVSAGLTMKEAGGGTPAARPQEFCIGVAGVQTSLADWLIVTQPMLIKVAPLDLLDRVEWCHSSADEDSGKSRAPLIVGAAFLYESDTELEPHNIHAPHTPPDGPIIPDDDDYTPPRLPCDCADFCSLARRAAAMACDLSGDTLDRFQCSKVGDTCQYRFACSGGVSTPSVSVRC